MSLEFALQYGTLFSLAVAVFSVSFGVVSHRRQVNATIYLNITERLHKLYRSLPDEVREAQLTGEEISEANRRRAAVIVVDFLHLMSTAFTLYKTGYFSGSLWKAISAEAQRGLRLPVFIEEWPLTRSEFLSNPGFVAYVETTQTSQPGKRRHPKHWW